MFLGIWVPFSLEDSLFLVLSLWHSVEYYDIKSYILTTCHIPCYSCLIYSTDQPITILTNTESKTIQKFQSHKTLQICFWFSSFCSGLTKHYFMTFFVHLLVLHNGSRISLLKIGLEFMFMFLERTFSQGMK